MWLERENRTRTGRGRMGWLVEEMLLGSEGGVTRGDTSEFMETGWVRSSGLHKDKEQI